jgi:hypothetical protein
MGAKFCFEFASQTLPSRRTLARRLAAVALGTSLLVTLAGFQAGADPTDWKREGWNTTDFSKSLIKWSDIISGGPPKDGIPSIDNPVFKAAGEDNELAGNDPVIGLHINGDARAYPLRVLIWHEIVNDVVGSAPVTITYCPLCNSAIVFDRRVPPFVLDFGTTGKLRNSDLVMYDRQTESWWQQFTGEAIVGQLTGTELKLVPSRLESFAQFKARHPSGKVLVPNDPKLRDYGRNPYVGYDMRAAPFLYRGDYPKDVEAMARVVVVRPDPGKLSAVTLEHLRKNGRLTIGDIELAWEPGQSTALDHWDIAQGRDVGTVTASRIGADSQRRDAPYDVTFAFVVFAFHPDVAILKD